MIYVALMLAAFAGFAVTAAAGYRQRFIEASNELDRERKRRDDAVQFLATLANDNRGYAKAMDECRATIAPKNAGPDRKPLRPPINSWVKYKQNLEANPPEEN